MAVTPVAMYRAALTTTTTTTLATVPSSKTWSVTNIVVTNTTGSQQTVTLALDGVAMLSARPIAANDTLAFDLKQVLAATKTITGGASSTSVTCHISGAEVG